MRLLKFFQYAYLAFAMLFVYDAIANWTVSRTRTYLSLAFAALAIFMYFFRKRFRDKFEDRNKL